MVTTAFLKPPPPRNSTLHHYTSIQNEELSDMTNPLRGRRREDVFRVDQNAASAENGKWTYSAAVKV